MKTPIYAITNGKAIKAVRTWLGKLEVLRYCPETDEFVRDMQFLEHIYFPTETKALDTDIVSKREFNTFVEKLRKQYKKPGVELFWE
jgi:hypothetical protein